MRFPRAECTNSALVGFAEGLVIAFGRLFAVLLTIVLSRRRKLLRALIHGLNHLLDGIHLGRLEIGLAALTANPCRDPIENQVVAGPVDLKGSITPLH